MLSEVHMLLEVYVLTIIQNNLNDVLGLNVIVVYLYFNKRYFKCSLPVLDIFLLQIFEDFPYFYLSLFTFICGTTTYSSKLYFENLFFRDVNSTGDLFMVTKEKGRGGVKRE